MQQDTIDFSRVRKEICQPPAHLGLLWCPCGLGHARTVAAKDSLESRLSVRMFFSPLSTALCARPCYYAVILHPDSCCFP